MSDSLAERQRRARWRLILGSDANECLGGCLSNQDAERDQALGFLYDREYGSGRNRRGQSTNGADLSPSQLNVPDWINAVHELFPRRTIERLERDALERYQLQEIVTNPDLLQRAEPSLSLLKAVLQTKHLMNQDVLAMARTLVRKIVQDLIEKLARPVRNPLLGTRLRRRSFVKNARNFDWRTTIRRNLRNFDPARRQLVIDTPYFISRSARKVDQWQIIILVDQSGSMVSSVIHSAVTAAIFHGIPQLKTHLVAFDTSVVDLTSDVTDPVETLMKVQLGGGTDIGQAMQYGASLVENPRRTMLVLITDFYEGAPGGAMFRVCKQLTGSGVKVLGLAALDEQAFPRYDEKAASEFVHQGAEVGAMTPGELANWVGEKMK